MKTLETPLIAVRSKRQLSALGFKQLNRIQRKACEANGTHHYARESKTLKDQVEQLIYSLIFDHNVTKEQLSQLQKAIKVINGKLEIPAFGTISI